MRCSDAARFKGLAAEDMLVYQCIQSAGNMGGWAQGRGVRGVGAGLMARLTGAEAAAHLTGWLVGRAAYILLPALTLSTCPAPFPY